MRDYNDYFHLKDGSYTGVTLMSHTHMFVGVHPAGNGSNKEKKLGALLRLHGKSTAI